MSSPIIVVWNKNGDLRVCVAYRELNDVTRKDCLSLLGFDDVLDTVAGAKWFSTMMGL
jgi:hypothetical protein